MLRDGSSPRRARRTSSLEIRASVRTKLSNLYATANILLGRLSTVSCEGGSTPERPESRTATAATVMRQHVRERGSRLVRIPIPIPMHAAPACPAVAYHSTFSAPTNHAIVWARSTLRSLQTRGSCRPRSCLLAKWRFGEGERERAVSKATRSCWQPDCVLLDSRRLPARATSAPRGWGIVFSDHSRLIYPESIRKLGIRKAAST